jgi:hypothetical protein
MGLLRPLPHTVTDRGDDRQPRSPGRSDQWGRVAGTRKLRSQRLSRARRATRSMGLPPVSKLWPRCGHSRDRCAPCPGTNAPDGPPTIDTMPLEIHTQPDPDHFCETCGGPSELVSQTITSWDGNEPMARDVSPWTPRCADPRCRSRRPRHSKRTTRASAGTEPVGRYR